jgi:uncharacterized protein (TIGR02246 family)
MKTRLLVPLAGLAISFALPIYAQQKDVADPLTTQKILAIGKAFDDAHMNNDAAGIAELFTRDAVMVTPEAPIIGREAIQKWHADLYQSYHPRKVDRNAPHLIGTASNELWAKENGVRLGKARTANLSQSTAIGHAFC